MRKITIISKTIRFLKKSNFIRKVILPKYRIFRNYFRYSRVVFKFTPAHLPKSENLYWVNSKDIVFHTNYRQEKYTQFRHRVFDMWHHYGKAVGGDWDVSSFKFEDLEVFKAIKTRMQDNIEWKDTQYYHLLLNNIKHGYSSFDCINETDLNAYFKSIDSLIESIKQNGYKDHKTRIKDKKNKDVNSGKFYSDEVTVNISRDGKYLFQNGSHRLSIALVLGVEKIPVKVLVRHKEWVLLRKKILKIASKSGGKLYQPALHIDLLDIPSSHKCVDRFNEMKKHLPISKGVLLDVGAYFGYFSHKFEELGFKCVAVEISLEMSEVAVKIKTSIDKKFEIITGNILDIKVSSQAGNNYDVVLFLNILHHFLKEEYKYREMTKWLKNLQAKIIFFEPHLPSEGQMQDAYLNYNNSEFLQYIMKHTGKINYKKIYVADDGRPLYMIT